MQRKPFLFSEDRENAITMPRMRFKENHSDLPPERKRSGHQKQPLLPV
ncbi:hypothetical protein B4135_3240 [Caldibacillus debilis]|uniref:Uncharacterized protein n=1 Tax=Caldibacillus debilis TaxID=301148 RepID=A0A150LFV6_9BACI|nr:hypothetical protein B4135_3240 [Caldibacillus debilis]